MKECFYAVKRSRMMVAVVLLCGIFVEVLASTSGW